MFESIGIRIADSWNEQVEYLILISKFKGQSKVVICGVARTPIGASWVHCRLFQGVDFKAERSRNFLARTGINPESGIIEEVLFGQVLQA